MTFEIGLCRSDGTTVTQKVDGADVTDAMSALVELLTQHFLVIHDITAAGVRKI